MNLTSVLVGRPDMPAFNSVPLTHQCITEAKHRTSFTLAIYAPMIAFTIS
jgi:hypothetical protein